jgi:hypothetical protein
MVASSLKRADEIGFEESLDLIVFLLALSRQLLVHDVVDEDGPTKRDRMCCWSKPTGEQ